jgi:antitoxin HigA-1
VSVDRELFFRVQQIDGSRVAEYHPGEVLEEEFWKPLNITPSRLAQAIRIPQTRVTGIIRRQRRVTPNLALRVAKFFGTSPQFWLGLQMDYDLEEEQRHIGSKLETIS